jgi:hypothetical protein
MPQAIPAQTQQLSGMIFQFGSVRALTVPVAPEVQAAVATKAELDVTELARMVAYRGRTPVLTLKDGKRVALAPLSNVRKVSPQLRSEAKVLLKGIEVFAPYFRHAFRESDSGSPALSSVVNLAAKPSVDHRSCQTPIRDQGSRGTCTAFASVAAIEAFESCQKHQSVQLSEEHAYHIFMHTIACTCPEDCGIATYKAAQYLVQGRICSAAQMPYTADTKKLPSDDSNHVPMACLTDSKYGFTDAGTKVILGTAYGGPTDQNANNPEYLESVLYGEHDIVYGLWVAGTSWADGTAETGVIDVQKVSGQPAAAIGGHAMLLVGYDRAHSFFIFKNSWGESHGHSGYFYVSYDYVRTYGKYGYIVTDISD